jgi:hypothetical protein
MIVLKSHTKKFFKFKEACLFGKETHMVSYYVSKQTAFGPLLSYIDKILIKEKVNGKIVYSMEIKLHLQSEHYNNLIAYASN